MTAPRQDIGAVLKYGCALDPVSAVDAGTDVNSDSFDRMLGGQPASCVFAAQVGAVTGSPTSFIHVFKVEESADDSAWNDYADKDGNGATITITAISTLTEVDVDLMPAKRYVRLTYDASASSFSGGSSPTATISGSAVFGGFAENPQD